MFDAEEDEIMNILALDREVPGVTDDQFTEEILKADAR